MSEYAPYSDTLSDQDTQCGFELIQVKNPHGQFAFSPEFVNAVVYRVNSTDRIIKFNNPVAGRPTYHHQRYGIWGDWDKRADWKPVGSISYPTPEWAVRARLPTRRRSRSDSWPM